MLAAATKRPATPQTARISRNALEVQIMLEAHIVSPRGSLYYAGESDPYDLEMLWEHVRDAGGEIGGHGIQIELRVDDDGIEPPVSAWIHRVTAIGAQVQLLFMRSHAPDPTLVRAAYAAP